MKNKNKQLERKRARRVRHVRNKKPRSDTHMYKQVGVKSSFSPGVLSSPDVPFVQSLLSMLSLKSWGARR